MAISCEETNNESIEIKTLFFTCPPASCKSHGACQDQKLVLNHLIYNTLFVIFCEKSNNASIKKNVLIFTCPPESSRLPGACQNWNLGT